jgi:Putative MetA-pathway of phenol degradation
VKLQRIVAGLVVLALIGAAPPVSAKIVKTRRTGEYKDYRELALTIGSAFEFEIDSEESQYGFPFLIEYGVNESWTLAVEPDYLVIDPAEGPSSSGFDDLETSVVYEFVRERRNRPAFASELLIKWPTATHDSLGSGEIDYSLALIVSKEFVRFEVDAEVLYTFVGDPTGMQYDDALEISIAGDWHMNRTIDLLTEVVTSSGGGIRGRTSAIEHAESGDNETEATLGLAEQIGDHLKLEQGVVYNFDESWQWILAWEWNFGEGE